MLYNNNICPNLYICTLDIGLQIKYNNNMQLCKHYKENVMKYIEKSC